MNPTNREIAQAFSSHRFELAIPHLAPDVHWNLVGADPIDGRAEVTEVCRETATELTDTHIRIPLGMLNRHRRR